MKRNYHGSANGNWKGGKVTRQCEVCNEQYRAEVWI